MADRVTVYVKAEGTPTDAEDIDVPGVYKLDLDADLADGEIASAALDVFHQNRPVGTLDDFSFTVFDAAGNSLQEGDCESYKLGHRGSFVGQVGDDDIPTPPAVASL